MKTVIYALLLGLSTLSTGAYTSTSSRRSSVPPLARPTKISQSASSTSKTSLSAMEWSTSLELALEDTTTPIATFAALAFGGVIDVLHTVLPQDECKNLKDELSPTERDRFKLQDLGNNATATTTSVGPTSAGSYLDALGEGRAVHRVESDPQGESYLEALFGGCGSVIRSASSSPTKVYTKLQGNVMGNSYFSSMGTGAAASSPPPPECPAESAPQGGSSLEALSGVGGSVMKLASSAPTTLGKKAQGNDLGNVYFTSIGTGAIASSPPPPENPVESSPQGGSNLEALSGVGMSVMKPASSLFAKVYKKRQGNDMGYFSSMGTGAAASSPPPPASLDESTPQGEYNLEALSGISGPVMKPASSLFAKVYKKRQGNDMGYFSSMGTGAAASSPPPPASLDESTPQGECNLEALSGVGGSVMKLASSAPTTLDKKVQSNELGNMYFLSMGTGATACSPPPPASPVESAPKGGSYPEALSRVGGSVMKLASSLFAKVYKKRQGNDMGYFSSMGTGPASAPLPPGSLDESIPQGGPNLEALSGVGMSVMKPASSLFAKVYKKRQGNDMEYFSSMGTGAAASSPPPSAVPVECAPQGGSYLEPQGGSGSVMKPVTSASTSLPEQESSH
jgi:hypothetical protein